MIQWAFSSDRKDHPQDFRFMFVCEQKAKAFHDAQFRDIVTELVVPAFPARADLSVVLSVVLLPHMHGRPVDLMIWRLGRNGERQEFGESVGKHYTLPTDGVGPVLIPYSLPLLFEEEGIYGVDLFDPEGLFGEPAGHLSTFLYSVSAPS